MASNPNPLPLLNSLADTPQKQADIQALNMFLFLLREQAGGDSGVVPISSGGTGATNASDARTNLGVQIGVDVQAYNIALDEAIAFFQNTDITGAEAETLTDGSDASSLHTHAAETNLNVAARIALHI